MSVVGLFVVGVLVVAGFAVLNNGPIDKESKRRQAFWTKVEEDRP